MTNNYNITSDLTKRYNITSDIDISSKFYINDQLQKKFAGISITWVRPGLSDVRTTPHCLVSALISEDFPTFDRPALGT